MIADSASWNIRQARPADRELIDGLLEGTGVQHRHLDWTQPRDLLGEQPFYLATERGLPVGCLACPEEPENVSWVRLFAAASPYDPQEVWDRLWPNASEEAKRNGVEQAAVLCLPDWLQEILEKSGFELKDEVIFFEWETGSAKDLPAAPEGMEHIQPEDLPEVTHVDNSAFKPLWRHTQATLRLALEQSTYATQVRKGDRVVAYQISTASAFGGHLARLAVLPEFQGQGLASALVGDLLRHFRNHGYPRVTVNTQRSNTRSLELYRGIGFRSMDRSYPVYGTDLK